MKRYSFLISFTPEYADCALLASRCISVMHGFTLKNNLKGKIGISFPSWSEKSLGNAVAFTSENREALLGLAYQVYFTTMKNNGLFQISSIIEVPNDVAEVRFIRNNAINKTHIDSKKRRISRVLRRAEAIGKVHAPINKEERTFAPFHSIFMASESTKRQFVIHVQKESAETVITTNFNSYGFATNEIVRGTVPELPLDIFKSTSRIDS